MMIILAHWQFLALFFVFQSPSGGARIIPKNDGDLTVFPDVCEDHFIYGSTTTNTRSSGNCGIHRLYGDHPWTLRSDDGAYHDIPTIVPGDILTDLEEAGIIGDPFYENNFLDQRHVWMGEEKVLSNGTTCYSAQRSDDDTSHEHPENSGTRTKGEYRIPHLERRTRTWIYETNFNHQYSSFSFDHRRTAAKKASGYKSHAKHYALVVEGIKMGATIELNGISIGIITDQFLRYIFPISESILHHSLTDTNTLSIIFDPDIDTHGRFMACSGGWDWAPYSMAAEASCSSRRVLTFGIYKPIYLIEVYHVAIVNVVPKIRYLGDPTVEIVTGKFNVTIDVHLQMFIDGDSFLDNASCGEVIFRSSFVEDQILNLNDSREKVLISSPTELVVSLNVVVFVEDVNLWWPNGMHQGDPSLYSLYVSYRDPCQGHGSEWVERQIGFRTVALVTHNEDQDIPLDGTGNFGMFFRINGQAVWARGANVVPMEQLEGRFSDKAHRELAKSAFDANMNMLRVWGGGVVMPLSFYRYCNELGIMLFHDLMFVEEQFHALEKTITVENEIRYIVRSLNSYPSIVLWNGCNECTSESNDLYATFALTIVAQEDGTRPVWWSSPSSGFSSGVFGIDGTPNGKKLIYNFGHYDSIIEEHGPYNHGYSKSFSTVNGHQRKGDKYDTRTPFRFKKVKTGLSHPNQFVSEFGASVFSSFESMSDALHKINWGLHGNSRTESNCTVVYENANECQGSSVLAQRNYPCDSHIEAFFGDIRHIDQTGEKTFQLQLYQCLLSQMLWMKGTIEELRSKNSFGTLIWQMNDNWRSGSWGILEYDGHLDDRGRWKPLMYLLQRSLFRDVFATCGASIDGIAGSCYIRNDGVAQFDGNLLVEKWSFSGEVQIIFTRSISLPPNGSIEYFDLSLNNVSLQTTCVVIRVLDEYNEDKMGQNLVLWKLPKQLNGLANDPGIILNSVVVEADGRLTLTLETKQVALYICLASSIHGDFDDNAFSMPAGSTRMVRFSPSLQYLAGKNLEKAFEKSLRIDHLGMVFGLAQS